MDSKSYKNIQEFAREMLGFDIQQYQVEMIQAIIEGKQIKYVTQAGRVTATKVALAYIQKYGQKNEPHS